MASLKRNCSTRRPYGVMLLSQFPSTSAHFKFKERLYISSHNSWLLSCRLGWSSFLFKRCFSGGYFWTRAFAVAEFCEWVQVRTDVYIPHSSPWFSAAYAAAVVHRNHIFYFCLHKKYALSKIKFRQTIDHCKRFLGAVKLAYANKTKYITPQNFGSF